jgi:hypothetical protein
LNLSSDDDALRYRAWIDLISSPARLAARPATIGWLI